MSNSTLEPGAEVSSEDQYQLDQQVGHILRLASQRHAAIFQANSINDLTPTQFAAVVQLAQMGECSQNRLGRMTAMDVATIKGVVDRLSKKGFVQLRRDESDKRRTLISLTAKAQALVGELHQIGAEISAKTLQPLTASEQRNFLRLLRKLT